MANKKLSGLTELAETPASGDMVPVVDVSDTTGAATGTTKKVSVTNLLASKQDTLTGGATTIDTEDLTASRALESNSSGKVAASAVTAAELSVLGGITSTTGELNTLDGITSTTVELNLLDGVTATTGELNILDGVTSTAAELNILDGVTATTAELNYVDGVTSSIQTQLDAAATPTHTGEVTGGAALTVADDVVDEANLKVDNSPTDNFILTAKSSAAGGLTWGAAGAGGDVNQNAWSTITVPAGTTSQAADTATDSVAFTAGGGMTITGGADDTIEFSSADTNTNQLTTFTLNGTTATTPTTVNHGDTITIAAGTGITTTSTSDGVVTVASTVTDTNTNQLTTFTVSATTDTTATTISQGDDLFFAAGTGITCETTADGTVTVASTVTDTNTNQLTTFDVGVDTNTNATTIAHGETLTLTGGANVTTETTADGTVTIAATDTNTTYTAGDGLTLTGTDFDLSVSELTDISGTGDVSGWSAGDTVAIVDSSDSNASKRIKLPAEIGIACSDETTAITVGNTAADTQKASILIPRAMTVTEIKCNLYKKDSSTVTVDVNYHATAPESAVTLLNNPASDLSMATTALTASTGTFASAATSYVLAENSFVTVDVDAAGTNALGLKVWLLGYWT
jgi:hypothetical protein